MKSINILKKINLSSTNKLILESVNKFCNQELKQIKNISNKDLRKIYKNMGNNGFLGPVINGYGCLGLNYLMYGLIAKEIEYIDSSFRSMYSVQSSLVMNPINKYGSKYIKEKYLHNL